MRTICPRRDIENQPNPAKPVCFIQLAGGLNLVAVMLPPDTLTRLVTAGFGDGDGGGAVSRHSDATVDD